VHKRGNVEDHLPENLKLTIGRRSRRHTARATPNVLNGFSTDSQGNSNGSIRKLRRRCAKVSRRRRR
jgi:hypothetical protein